MIEMSVMIHAMNVMIHAMDMIIHAMDVSDVIVVVIEIAVMHAIAVSEVFVLRTELVYFYHYDSAQSHYNTP
jgi:hypothetical protein